MYYSDEPNYGELRLKRIRVAVRGASLEFLTAPGVFSHGRIDRGSLTLAEYMDIPPSGKVLDLGCGYGFLGVLAAILAPSSTVLMIDSNKLAVKLSSINAKLNGAGNAVAKHLNALNGIDGEFDLIITNPPYSAGISIVFKFIVESARHLSRDGSLQLVVPSKMKNRILGAMSESFGSVTELGATGSYKVYKAIEPRP